MENNIPIRCSGIAVVLLQKSDTGYKVLLLKRNSEVLDEAWCYIGGRIEQGEKAWEAALREIHEETGLEGVVLYTSNKFDQFYSPSENYIYLAPVFVGFVDEGLEVILNDEHSDFKWFSFEEAIETASLPGNDEVLRFIEKHFVKKHPSKYLLIGS
ncbi:NUDIX hydrolase [Rossellomorea aquimaris]|uniref:NUDIX domain-containing protein n=1 Tax=Rossellomorea aquimaris TaxID=189382 RepID=A0A5D4TXH8_9BACI|nr:NUDIX domain-containing protein [Rossellomorea aquimaris]TYS79708.1 NUDIX domain-containing protein [Rossellomorea aquimaris]